MSFRTAYLERCGEGVDGLEERIVEEEVRRRGIETAWYTQKQIDRWVLPLGDETFVMGSIPAMHGAMKQLGIPIPPPNDYPASLQAFLHRRVWRSTLRTLEERIWEGAAPPLFAKPAERKKAFTGRVFTARDDLRFLGKSSRRQRIWCSEVVDWQAEFRVYVVDHQVVAMLHYDGDPSRQIDPAVVEEAVRTYARSGEAPAGYALDFGLLASGKTALVEANDGYSLGVYAAECEPYTDLLFARWAELLQSRGRA